MARKMKNDHDSHLLNLSDVLSGSVPDLSDIAALHYNNEDSFSSQSRPQPSFNQRKPKPSTSMPCDIQYRLPIDRPKSYDFSAHGPAATTAGLRLSTRLKFSPSSPALPNHLSNNNNHNSGNGHSPQWSISSTEDNSPLYMADSSTQKRPKKSASPDKEGTDIVCPTSPTPKGSTMAGNVLGKENKAPGTTMDKTKPQRFVRPSVKHLTCYWWKVKGACRFNESECLYAHHDTGKIAEAPRHLVPGEKAVAGRNLEHRLAQGMPHPVPLDTPTLQPGWMASNGIGYAHAGNRMAYKRPTSSSESLASMQTSLRYPAHIPSIDLSVTDNANIQAAPIGHSTNKAGTPFVTRPENEIPTASSSADYHYAPIRTPSPISVPTSHLPDTEIRKLRQNNDLLEKFLMSVKNGKDALQRDKNFLQEQLSQHTVDRHYFQSQVAEKNAENHKLQNEVQILKEELAKMSTEKQELEMSFRDQTNTLQCLMRRNTSQSALRASASANSFLPLPGPGPIQRPKPGPERLNSSG